MSVALVGVEVVDDRRFLEDAAVTVATPREQVVERDPVGGECALAPSRCLEPPQPFVPCSLEIGLWRRRWRGELAEEGGEERNRIVASRWLGRWHGRGWAGGEHRGSGVLGCLAGRIAGVELEEHDIVPSLRDENLRRLGTVLEELETSEPALVERVESLEPVTAQTRSGELRIVPEPWGTRGYDDLRIRANRENLGRGARPAVASVVDCVRMLDASERALDAERLVRLRRLMELERQLVPSRRLGIER
jgi:hypothetical protein